MTSWLVAPTWTARAAWAGTAVRRSATSGMTGLPAVAARAPIAARSKRSARHCSATASAVRPFHQAGVGGRAGQGRLHVEHGLQPGLVIEARRARAPVA